VEYKDGTGNNEGFVVKEEARKTEKRLEYDRKFR
jgi:hypothetical protein